MVCALGGWMIEYSRSIVSGNFFNLGGIWTGL